MHRRKHRIEHTPKEIGVEHVFDQQLTNEAKISPTPIRTNIINEDDEMNKVIPLTPTTEIYLCLDSMRASDKSKLQSGELIFNLSKVTNTKLSIFNNILSMKAAPFYMTQLEHEYEDPNTSLTLIETDHTYSDGMVASPLSQFPYLKLNVNIVEFNTNQSFLCSSGIPYHFEYDLKEKNERLYAEPRISEIKFNPPLSLAQQTLTLVFSNGSEIVKIPKSIYDGTFKIRDTTNDDGEKVLLLSISLHSVVDIEEGDRVFITSNDLGDSAYKDYINKLGGHIVGTAEKTTTKTTITLTPDVEVDSTTKSQIESHSCRVIVPKYAIQAPFVITVQE